MELRADIATHFNVNCGQSACIVSQIGYQYSAKYAIAWSDTNHLRILLLTVVQSLVTLLSWLCLVHNWLIVCYFILNCVTHRSFSSIFRAIYNEQCQLCYHGATRVCDVRYMNVLTYLIRQTKNLNKHCIDSPSSVSMGPVWKSLLTTAELPSERRGFVDELLRDTGVRGNGGRKSSSQASISSQTGRHWSSASESRRSGILKRNKSDSVSIGCA